LVEIGKEFATVGDQGIEDGRLPVEQGRVESVGSAGGPDRLGRLLADPDDQALQHLAAAAQMGDGQAREVQLL
jgi:hypothetical protein